MENKDNMKESKVSFFLTENELKILENVVYLEPFLMDVVDGAKFKNARYEVKFSAYDLEDALSALEYTAPAVKSYMEKETLYQLYAKIESFVNFGPELIDENYNPQLTEIIIVNNSFFVFCKIYRSN